MQGARSPGGEYLSSLSSLIHHPLASPQASPLAVSSPALCARPGIRSSAVPLCPSLRCSPRCLRISSLFLPSQPFVLSLAYPFATLLRRAPLTSIVRKFASFDLSMLFCAAPADPGRRHLLLGGHCPWTGVAVERGLTVGGWVAMEGRSVGRERCQASRPSKKSALTTLRCQSSSL